MSGAGQSVTFFYDFASPFAYLGATQIERIARAAGATVQWRPILVGGLFRQVGTPDVPLLVQSPPKQAYIGRDLQHWASHWQVPFAWPTRFPMRTVAALRLMLAIADDCRRETMVQTALALFAAYWADDRDLNDTAVLRDVASACGVPAATLERGLGPDEAIKQRLIANGADAVAAGVFGVPAFLVGEHLFWGQDRLDLVARMLAGWKPPTA